MYVTFEGDEQVYLKYNELSRRGERASSRDAANPVLVGLANEDGYPHHGAMVFVDNQLDPRTGTIRARAAFENKDGCLTPGLFARVQAARPTARITPCWSTTARSAPTRARSSCYVVDADNKVAVPRR